MGLALRRWDLFKKRGIYSRRVVKWCQFQDNYPIHINCTLCIFFLSKKDKIYGKSEMFDLLYIKNSACGILQKYEKCMNILLWNNNFSSQV